MGAGGLGGRFIGRRQMREQAGDFGQGSGFGVGVSVTMGPLQEARKRDFYAPKWFLPNERKGRFLPGDGECSRA